MKKLYFLDDEERQRILNIHESATKRHYLKEQEDNQTRKDANAIDSVNNAINSIKDPGTQPETLGGYNNQSIEKNAANKSAAELFKSLKFPTQASDSPTGNAGTTTTAPVATTTTTPAGTTTTAPVATTTTPAVTTTTSPVATTTTTTPAPIIVTNHDRAYDYKLENGKYLFKGKDNTTYGRKYDKWQKSKTQKGEDSIKAIFDKLPKPVETSTKTETQAIVKPDASSEVAKKTAEAGVTSGGQTTTTGQNVTSGGQTTTSTATGQNAGSVEGNNQTASSGAGVSEVGLEIFT